MTFGKVCDAADWFVPELDRIIRQDLHEFPRFHRKQWEFATVFHVLKSLGLLEPTNSALSMGGGKERLSYAVASRIKHLFITDLYDAQTMWDCARTEDPERFIKSDMPFPVDPSRLSALRMDMRKLEFPDASFDFCYSSCAIEHIGSDKDFQSHLKEVNRVLKEGGIYVFTTELHYGPELIVAPNNYIFSASYLNYLFSQSPLLPESEFDANLTPHRTNYPVPVTLDISILGSYLSDSYPHLQLLAGKHPFSSALFVLRKSASSSRSRIQFNGLEESLAFLNRGIDEFRDFLQKSTVRLEPYGALSGHLPTPDTLFHTTYNYFGSGRRSFELNASIAESSHPCVVELRLHRYRTLNQASSEKVACVRVKLNQTGEWEHKLTASLDENFCYAYLGKITEGRCRVAHLQTSTSPI